MTPLGASTRATRTALARQAAALLLSLKGSVCLYQGEELGLPETDILFEELTDPPGIRFWPEYKGRDGCRTPMPWDEGEAPNGFTTGKPWLPVKPPQSALNVAAPERRSGLDAQLLPPGAGLPPRAPGAGRWRHRVLQGAEPVLAFRRTGERREPRLHLQPLAPSRVRVTLERRAPTSLPISQGAERLATRA